MPRCSIVGSYDSFIFSVSRNLHNGCTNLHSHQQYTSSLFSTSSAGFIVCGFFHDGGRRSGRQQMRWLDGITDLMNMSLSNPGSWWWTGRPGVLQSMGSQRVGHNWGTELNWTELSNSFESLVSWSCTWRKKEGASSVSFKISANVWNMSKTPMFICYFSTSSLDLNAVIFSADLNTVVFLPWGDSLSLLNMLNMSHK